MIRKRVLCPQRLRRVPPRFSWVDHRLVREGHIRRCGPQGLALYLLLVTVGDEQGLSYYSDKAAAQLVSMGPSAVARARRELVEAGLIAYQSPLYQVLSLDRAQPVRRPQREDRGPASLGEVLQAMLGGES